MDKSLKNILRALLAFFLTQVLISGIEAQLLAQDASEGSCLSQSELLPHLYRYTRVGTSIIAAGDYYIPMASEALYREYAEGLLGRPAANKKELEGMQLVLRSGFSFSTIQNTGFPYMKQPPSFGQICLPASLPSYRRTNSGNVIQAVCVGTTARRPNGRLTMSASPSFATTMDSIVWVNAEKTVYLIYRCPANGIKDYKVVSKTKTLNGRDVQKIKDKIIPMGFREDHFAFMKYM